MSTTWAPGDQVVPQFVEANQKRVDDAAAVTVRRCRRALEIVNHSSPSHPWTLDVPALEYSTAEARIANPHDSLRDLGLRLGVSKHAVSSRLWRILIRADDRAHLLGIPDTNGHTA